ncbi:alpha/beta hydrolase [Microbulbifer sp. TYP-18]|uniref:alpha/beta hydrolase n=1 Tax=Microbulbifer sp. TYP-18 TaxID=3230024 RepID=UPI0034C5BCB2
MNKHLLAAIFFFLPLAALKASEPRPLELPKIQVVPIQDSSTGREYELLIKLPEEYAKSGAKKHPVIYFTDAIWAVEILSATVEYTIQDAILVGIGWQKNRVDWQKNLAGAEKEWWSRFRDLRPASDQVSHENKGEAHQFLAFLNNDVIKYVEGSYRANQDNRTYFGYSLGGAFGVYTLLNQPDIFQNYIIGSPSGLASYMGSLSEAGSQKPISSLPKQTNVFISYGALEHKLGDNVEKFVGQLRNRKPANLSLQSVVIESADHNTAFPKTSVRSIDWLAGRL